MGDKHPAPNFHKRNAMWRNLIILVGVGALYGLGFCIWTSTVVERYDLTPIPGGRWVSFVLGAVIGWMWLWANGYVGWSREPKESRSTDEHQDYWDKE